MEKKKKHIPLIKFHRLRDSLKSVARYVTWIWVELKEYRRNTRSIHTAIQRKSDWIPWPGGAFGDKIVAGDDELRDAENALLLEGGDRARPCDPLDRAFEGSVELRQNHGFRWSDRMVQENPNLRVVEEERIRKSLDESLYRKGKEIDKNNI